MRTAAVDQSELCLMYLDSDADDDLSLFTSQLACDAADYRGDHHRASVVGRADSTDSVDMFLANSAEAEASPRLQGDEGAKGAVPSRTDTQTGTPPRAPLGSPVTSPGGGQRPAVPPKPALKPKPCLKSPSEESELWAGPGAGAGPGVGPGAGPGAGGGGGEAPSRVAQRRAVRAERRYHTADAIEELRQKQRRADTSIHKRLSWNLGAVEAPHPDGGGRLAAKVTSCDSLRSVPSSSGVSSTGSLHAPPDLCDSPPTPTTKSMSDLSQLGASLSAAMHDGIVSVALPPTDGQRVQMTHAQIVRMTKHLLLNSTLEAS